MKTWRPLISPLGQIASDQQLRALQKSMLGALSTLRAELPDYYDKAASDYEQHQLLSDSSATLVIMGDRGSGKSTLLQSVCLELVAEGIDWVLPVMRPELFSDNDSVISTFLAALWGHLTAALTRERAITGSETGNDELLRLLADTARSQATSRTPMGALENATESTIDFAEDAIAVSRSGIRLARQLKQLARILCCGEDPTRPSRLVVVPIDDPDLAPHNVGVILRDLRTLGSVPGVVPIACLSPVDLNAVWDRDEAPRRSPTNAARGRQLYERELVKIFPYRSRFEIEPLSAAQRVSFVPVGETETVLDKLSAFRSNLRLTGDDWALDETLSRTTAEFGLPNPLPENPRSLVQLWETLDSAIVDSGNDGRLELTLRRLLDLLSEPVRLRLSSDIGDRFYAISPPLSSEPKDRPSLEVSLEPMRLFISAVGSFQSQTRSFDPRQDSSSRTPVAVVSLRRLHRVRASLPGPNPDTSTRDYLTPREVSAVLAVQEVACGSGVFEAGGDRLFIGSVEWNFLQKVTLAGLSTDDDFLFLPDATTLSEVTQAARAWNSIEAKSSNLSIEGLLSEVVKAACATVDPSAAVTDSGNYQEMVAWATALYRDQSKPASFGHASFRRWYERRLMFQWHTSLLRAEVIRPIVASYKETVNAQKAFEQHELPSGSDLDGRLKKILDAVHDVQTAEEHCWIAGYFDTAAELGLTQLPRLTSLSPQWRSRWTSMRAGSAIAERFVSQSTGVQQMAPYPTPEGQELLRAATELLRRRAALIGRIRNGKS